jgi:glycosyltransferase involved in cell wall biosynthesis
MSHIDVMVTCYNYGHFLRECVESVLAQSHRDLRVLIVDDASTDDTPAVCDELTARDPRVEILRHPVNRGHIPTYNECIAMARDDYLLVLSADDFLLPGALARAIGVLDAQPDVGLAHGARSEEHTSELQSLS